MTLILLSSYSLWSQDLNSQIESGTQEIASQIEKSAMKNIAVLDFQMPNGEISALGRSLSNKVRIKLSQFDNINIVNRSILQQVLKEEQLFKNGIINPETVSKIKFNGIDGIVIGEIADYGSSYSVELQLISTETSNIKGGAILDVPQTDDVRKMYEKIVVRSSGLINREKSQPDDNDYPEMGPTNDKTSIDGYDFTILSINIVGGDAICTFRIKNNQGMRSLRLLARERSSRILDNLNGEFPAKRIELKELAGYDIRKDLLQGVPVVGKIIFPNVDTRAKYFPLLEIYIETKSGRKKLSFTNIPVSR